MEDVEGHSSSNNPSNTQFRARYRARMKPSYSPAVHVVSVTAIGLLAIFYAASSVNNLQASELWAIPIMLCLANLGEYVTHRYWGHVRRRIGGLFYLRHTVDHHSFFTHQSMTIERWRDWRVVLFPTWLIVVLIVLLVPATLLLRYFFGENVAALSALVYLASYLLYEFMHTCFHLPQGHGLSRLPYIRWMAAHHAKHHDHAQMGQTNFNLTWPLCDVIFRTMSR